MKVSDNEQCQKTLDLVSNQSIDFILINFSLSKIAGCTDQGLSRPDHYSLEFFFLRVPQNKATHNTSIIHLDVGSTAIGTQSIDLRDKSGSKFSWD